MAFLPLPPDYLRRVERYYEAILEGLFAESKSDYWIDHSAKAKIKFESKGVQISGKSGFYVPHPASGSKKFQIAAWVQHRYKSAVLFMDRLVRLSSANHLSSLLTAEIAYDYVMHGVAPVAEDEFTDNPYRFPFSALQPLFWTGRDLRNNWFLKDKYLPDGHTYLAAYEHALFTHFAEGRWARYIEIGAGNGNLASFFAHYNNSHVVVIDLPEILLFSSCFLKSIFPQASVLLPNDVDYQLSMRDFDTYDFVFLVPSQVRMLPQRTFDLIVNTSSMQEMTLEQIEMYFDLVQAIAKDRSLWCNINRVEKFSSRKEGPIRAQAFPYNRRNEVLVDQIDPYLRLIQCDDHQLHIERVRV